MRCDGRLNDPAKISGSPVITGKQIIRPGQSHNPRAKRNAGIRQGDVTAQCLRRDGLHDGKRVIYPVVQFSHQNIAVLLGAASFGDVACNAGCADQCARTIPQRRVGDRYPHR